MPTGINGLKPSVNTYAVFVVTSVFSVVPKEGSISLTFNPQISAVRGEGEEKEFSTFPNIQTNMFFSVKVAINGLIVEKSHPRGLDGKLPKCPILNFFQFVGLFIVIETVRAKNH
jgi:hypothetical protein